MENIFIHKELQYIGRIYQYIYNKKSISKKELVNVTQLKQTTLTRYLKEMIKKDLIFEYYGESTGGRPPAFYRINPDQSYIVGIEISRTVTRIVVVDLNLHMIDQSMFSMTKDHTPQVTIELILRNIHHLLRNRQIPKDKILGIGVGAVGPIDRKNGIILNPEQFPAPGWENISIIDDLKKAFSKQIILLENGANTAALAEYYQSTKKYKNILYCISGVGLRCGVLANGQIVQNKTGNVSSFGHMIIKSDHKLNSNRILSDYISFNTILDEINHRKKEQQLYNKKINTSTINQMISRIDEEDNVIKEVLLESAYYYGIGLANLVNTLHPEQVILNSLLIYKSPLYYEKIVATMKKNIYKYDSRVLHISKGTLKNDAISIGAAALVLHSLFQSIKEL